MSYINTFGAATVQSADTSYAFYDLFLDDLTLFWPSAFQDTTNVVYDYMNITAGDQAGQTITLPAANLASVGVSFKFINVGDAAINILNYVGAVLLTINSGQAWEFYLTNNTTPAGVWGFIPAGAGVSGVVSLTSVQPAAGLVINQNATTGAITQTFTLANDLLAIENLAGTGYAVRTAADTWVQRSITQGSNITITNPAGIAGNTTVALNAALTNLVAVTVGNINLSSNVILGTQLNQNIIVSPIGTGELQSTNNANIRSGNQLKFYNAANTFYTSILGGNASTNTSYTLPIAYPVSDNQVLGSTTGGVMGWLNAVTSPGATTTNAVAKYLNTTGQLADSGILIDAFNNVSGAQSNTIQNIAIGTIATLAGTGTNTIAATNASGSLILMPRAGGQVNILGDASISAVSATAQTLFFDDGASANFVGLKAQNAAMGSSTTYVLPASPPSVSGQVLSAATPVANTSITSWATPAVIQVVSTSSTTATSTAAVIPGGTTIPQIGEGTELLTVTITPKTNGRLIIEFSANISNVNPASYIMMALFQDNNANAIDAGAWYNTTSASGYPLYFRHVVAAATPNVATTFRLRYGVPAAGPTAYILTAGIATWTFGGVPQMTLSVTELAP